MGTKTFFQVSYLSSFQFEPAPVEYRHNQVSTRKFNFDMKIDPENVKVLGYDDKNDANKLHLILKRVVASFPENHPARIWKMTILQAITVDRGNGSKQMWQVYGKISPELEQQLLDWLPSFEDYETCLSVEGRIENVTAIAQNNSLKSKEAESPIYFKKLHPTCFMHCWKEQNHHDCRTFETGLDICKKLDPKINYSFTGDLTISLKICKPIVSAALALSKFKPISNIARDVHPFNEQLLKEKLYTDMYIKTDSGTSIPCHRHFLAATSPVIAAIFKDRLARKTENWSAENNIWELKIENISDEAIHAFLDFVYCGDIEKSINSGNICVELLILANRYNVTFLEEKMLRLLFLKCKTYFSEDIESLLKCYVFLEMIGICKVVEITLAEIINEKTGVILLSEAYLELTNGNTNAATIIEKCFLD